MVDLADVVLTPVRDLGGFIRDQRESAQISLRQLAKRAGVSNPYLSQIERGLRKPSADMLAQIARGLQISVETLLTRAGVLDSPNEPAPAVVTAIQADDLLSERQKATLLEVYSSFRREAQAHAQAPASTAEQAAPPSSAFPTEETEGDDHVVHH